MRNNILALLALLALLAWGVYDYSRDLDKKASALSQTTSSPDQTVGTSKGDLAPNFQLHDLEGNTVQLRDLEGKVVLLNFWATWCPPCRAEMPQIEKFHADYGEEVAVLAVNLTYSEKNLEHVKSFVSKYAFSFPVLRDEIGEIANLFGIFAYPTTYVLDTQGIVRSIHHGAIDYRTMKEVTSSLY